MLTASLAVALIPPSPAMRGKLDQAEDFLRQCPQVEVPTEHLIHGGMYARTIRRGPGIVAVGSTILRATILIVHGDCTLIDGNGGRVNLTGYNVLPGLAGRKSLSLTHSDVEMTMIFPTSATTVEDAENEIFAGVDDLLSHREKNLNRVTVTGQ